MLRPLMRWFFHALMTSGASVLAVDQSLLPAGATIDECRDQKSVQHIVWDWNGTLLADEDTCLAAMNACLTHLDVDPVGLDSFRDTFGYPLRRSVEKLLDRSLDEQEWQELNAIFRRRYADGVLNCDLASGALSALVTAGAAGLTQSLLSLWPDAELVRLVAHHGLSERFSLTSGLSGGEPHGKADALRAHVAKLAIPAERVVVVGDVTDDALAARTVGARCILVTEHSFQHVDDLRANARIVETVEQAVAALIA